MYKNHQVYQTSTKQLFYQIPGSLHSQGIGKVNVVWDHQRKQVVLLVESDQMFSDEVKPLLNGNILILNAPIRSEAERPLRMHLLDRTSREEIESGFSEVNLKPGYNYSIADCTLITPNLLKVILQYRINHNHNE